MLFTTLRMTGTESNVTRWRAGWTGAAILSLCVAVGLMGLAGCATPAESLSWGGDSRICAAYVVEDLRGTPESDALPFAGELALQEQDSPLYGGPTTLRTRDPVRSASRPVATASADASKSLSESEKVHQRLTARYENPVSVRFLKSLSANRGIQLYVETGRLIDARHLQPVSYDARVRQAATNLWYAVKNRSFLETNGVRPSTSQVNAFREGLKGLILGSPIRTQSDALNMLYGTMNLANRHLGVPPATVAMEFVYGSVESLDEYSGFVPDDVSRQPSATLEDHVVGIGVEIKQHDSGALVEKVIPGTPAAEAGLRGNDIITSVNGKSLNGKSLDYAADLITGPAGSRVLLGIQRDGKGTLLITLTRRSVPVYSVSDVKIIDEDAKVGYLKLSRFAKKSSEEVDQALWSLHRQGMQSLVIDLRGNPGGLLTTAIEISDKFLPCGTIVSTRGRVTSDNSLERAHYEQTWKIPLVVLVDHDSASASEIFAAAIQENRRGLVVGRKSYGKGTVQTHFPLESVSGSLKLTTARFYSPTGRVMAGNGVTPNVTVTLAASALEASQTNPADIPRAVAVAKGREVVDLANSHIGHRTGIDHDLALNN